jgi:hypothetical protein
MVQYYQVQVVRAVQEDCLDCLNIEDEGTAVLQSNGELLTQYHMVISQKTRILSLLSAD